MASLREKVASLLHRTAEQMLPGSGNGVVRYSDMYLMDLQEHGSVLFGPEEPRYAVPVYVEDKPGPGDLITLRKQREGLFVVFDDACVLARSIGPMGSDSHEHSGHPNPHCPAMRAAVEGH